MDDQSIWKFFDQLFSDPAGQRKINRLDTLGHDTKRHQTYAAIKAYEQALNEKNRLMEPGAPTLTAQWNSLRPEDAFSFYNPVERKQIQGARFVNEFPGSWSRIANTLPENRNEQRQLWDHLFGANATNPTHLDRNDARTLGARAPGKGIKDVPIIPVDRGFEWTPQAAINALDREADQLRWMLIPDAYRKVLAGRRKVLNSPLFKTKEPKPEPPKKSPPRTLSTPDWANSATQHLFNSQEDIEAGRRALYDLDTPFHPLISAGIMPRIRADEPNADILNERRQRQNEEVIKNRRAARNEAVAWTPDSSRSSDAPRLDKWANPLTDYEQTLIDPRQFMSGFTNDNMMRPSTNQYQTNKEAKQWNDAINVWESKDQKHAAEMAYLNPAEANRLHEERMRKDPEYRRQVESKVAWDMLMMEDDIRKKDPRWNKNILGIGGAGILGSQVLSKAKKTGGR